MQRDFFLEKLNDAFKVHPIVAILGPRQCGKTTLAKAFLSEKNKFSPENYFDLEDATDLARLSDPKIALSHLNGLITIDEIQRRPDLFPALRVIVDNTNREQKFLILGSASRDLLQQSSETLAGRIGYLELMPFSYRETSQLATLWLRGGFPLSFLADTDAYSGEWRKAYVQTFLEKDIPNLGIRIPSQQLRRFWMMLAHYHAGLFNASEIGRSLNLSSKTIRNYLDILVGTFMVRELQPWFANTSKRQIKSPKIYFRDSGILHTLLGIADRSMLLTHPKLGASWEGLALEEIIRFHQATPEECYFWGTQAHAELDLLIFSQGKKLGFEFKHTDAPKITKSMLIAIEDLQLDQLTIIYPGKYRFSLSDQIEACGLETYLT